MSETRIARLRGRDGTDFGTALVLFGALEFTYQGKRFRRVDYSPPGARSFSAQKDAVNTRGETEFQELSVTEEAWCARWYVKNYVENQESNREFDFPGMEDSSSPRNKNGGKVESHQNRAVGNRQGKPRFQRGA